MANTLLIMVPQTDRVLGTGRSCVRIHHQNVTGDWNLDSQVNSKG